MQDLDEQRDSLIDDATLDQLLGQWKNDEIELPAGFHEQTMAQIRAEQKKQKCVVSLFRNQKKWISVAVAAMFMLFSIPIMQGELPFREVQIAGEEELSRQMVRVAVNPTDVSKKSETETSVHNRITDQKITDNTAEVKTIPKQNVENAAEDSVNENTSMRRKTEFPKDKERDQDAVAHDMEEQDIPITAAYSLEDLTNGDVNARVGKMYCETFVMEEYLQTVREKTLEELEQEIEKLEKTLISYEVMLEETPDDESLQEWIEEQKIVLQELKQEIEKRTTKQTE